MDLSDTHFPSACLVGATAYGVQAARINCRKATLHASKWGKATLTDACFHAVEGNKVYFGHSDLRNADFSDARLRYASFRDCDLRGANFNNADLRFAQLNEARCEGANFSGAAIYGASLWDLSYDHVVSDSLDLSPDADRSVTTTSLRLAPLVYFLSRDRHFAEVIAILKLKTVVILGKDNTDEAYARLRVMAAVAESRGMIPILVRQQTELYGEPFLKKALLYCNLARYVIVENSAPAGQIVELPLTLFQGSVTAVLQEEGKGSTWLLEELLVRQRNVKRFTYPPGGLEAAVQEASEWCETAWTEFAEAYARQYGRLSLTYGDS
jgi:hypothetical protein